MKYLKLLLSATASIALAAALTSSSSAQNFPTILNASDLRRERGLPLPNSNRIRNASELRRERGLASPRRIRNASELRRERGLGVKR